MITEKDLGLSLSLFPKQELLLSHPDMIPDDYEVPGEVLFGGAAGGGKGAVRGEKIITPFGIKNWEDIKEGDSICDPLGTTQEVIEVHPWQNVECYTVTFNDGTSTVVSDNHLWNYWPTNTRTKKFKQYKDEAVDGSMLGVLAHTKIATTKQLKQKLDIYATSTRVDSEGFKRIPHLKIPICNPVTFTKSYKVPQIVIPPYVLGMLLGDGYLGASGAQKNQISVVEKELGDLKEILNFFNQDGCTSFEYHTVNNIADNFIAPAVGNTRVQEGLKYLGLSFVRSENKFVPDAYKLSSIENRYKLLQGLMDSDGYANPDKCSAEFCSTSKQLADDVVFLVRSLGGYANISSKPEPYYKKASGEKVYCTAAWRVYVSAPDLSKFFRLSRKNERARKQANGRNFFGKIITSIESVGIKEMRCITVSSWHGLYLTNDFTVTHNSYSMRAISITLALECPGVNIYLFRKTYTELDSNHMLGPNGYRAMLAKAVEDKIVRIDSQKNIIQFKNGPTGTYAGGSIIYLRHVQYEKDVHIYQGAEIHVLMIDEATHFSEPIYTFLRARVRLGSWNPPEKWKKWFPRIICSSNPGCVPYGDVLTTDGWKPIKDVKVGDCVYSQDSKTRDTTINKVTNTFEYTDYSELCHIKNSRLNIVCTEDHKIPTISDAKKYTNFSLKRIYELPNQTNVVQSGNVLCGNKIDTFRVSDDYYKRSRKLYPLEINHRDYAELMGWYLSEGCVYISNNGSRVDISQQKEYNRDKIESLLIRCGFKYTSDFQAFHIHSKEWADYLGGFGKSHEKYIPRELLHSTDNDVLFNSLMAGDGTVISSTSGVYYTSSTRLRDDFMELCVLLGYIVRFTTVVRSDREYPIYHIAYRKNKIGGTEFFSGNKLYKNRKDNTVHKSSVTREPFSGSVYSIEVENDHNFYIRQNGIVWLSGNSAYHNLWKHMFVDFVDKANPYMPKRASGEEGGMLRQYIPATIYDNPALLNQDPTYIDRLKGLGSPELVRAMLEGDWDIVAGGMFDDVWKKTVHVIEPFEIPRGWYLNRGFDWGSSKPFAVLWYAESNGEPVWFPDDTSITYPPGTLFVIDEWYGNNKRAKDPNTGIFMANNDIGRGIRLREENNKVLEPVNDRICVGPADNSIYTIMNNDSQAAGINAGYWDSPGRSKTDIFFAADKSHGSRVKRWSLIRDRLSSALDIELDKPMERPGLFIFNVCNDLIRTIPTAPRADNNNEDIDTNSEDHLLDALGYRVLQSRAGIGRLKTKIG